MPRAPGQTLLAIVRQVLSRAEIDRVIEPAIADLQHEWSAAASVPLGARLASRTRAYGAAALVVSRYMLVGAIRASLTPPPWSLVRQLIVSSLVMLGVAFGFRLFVQTPNDAGDTCLLDIVNWVSFQLAWLPFLWPAMLQPRTLEWARIPSPRASDLARLTGVWCVLCLVWVGWTGPILRYQYLIAIGQVAQAAAADQRTLPGLLYAAWLAPLASEALELHRRLIVIPVALIAGLLAWIALCRRPGAPPESSFRAHFGRGLVLAVTAMAIGMACEPTAGRIASEWIAVVVAATGAVGILMAFRLAERRETRERDA